MRPLGFAIKEWMEVYKKNEVKEATSTASVRHTASC